MKVQNYKNTKEIGSEFAVHNNWEPPPFITYNSIIIPLCNISHASFFSFLEFVEPPPCAPYPTIVSLAEGGVDSNGNIVIPACIKTLRCQGTFLI